MNKASILVIVAVIFALSLCGFAVLVFQGSGVSANDAAETVNLSTANQGELNQDEIDVPGHEANASSDLQNYVKVNEAPPSDEWEQGATTDTHQIIQSRTLENGGTLVRIEVNGQPSTLSIQNGIAYRLGVEIGPAKISSNGEMVFITRHARATQLLSGEAPRLPTP